MTYVNEVTQLMHDVFYESWMDEKDYEEIIDEVLKQTGVTIEQLSDAIEEGVNMGYPLQTQISHVKGLMANLLRRSLQRN